MPTIDELSVKFSSRGYSSVVKNVTNLASALGVMASSSKSLDNNKLSGFASALGLLKGNVPTKGQVTRLEDLAVAIASLNAAAGSGDLTSFATNINTVSSALGNLKGSSKKQIDNITSSLKQAGQQAQKTASQMKGIAPSTKAQTPNTPKVKTPPLSNDALAKQFADSNKEIEKTTINISKMKQSLLGLKTLVPTNKMKQLQESTEKARQKYNDLRESIRKAIEAGDLKPSSKGFIAKQKELDGLRKQYDDLILKQKQLAQEGGDVKINPNFGKAFSGVKEAVGGVKQVFNGIGSSIKTVNGYINTFISKIRSMGSASKKAKKDTSSLKDTVKSLAKEITRLSKMLKLMITRMALRAVIKELGNGFKSLALHSQEFDATMSGLINSSKTLSYSIAGMAGQLINALAPVLMKIIELVTRAVNALNQLFSALRGASTWNKAKDFTGSWSDSIKEANGAAKELKKTVLGFDELNQLQDNKNKGGGGGGITDMFEDVPIDPWFKDLSEKIKKWAEKLFKPIKDAWAKVGNWVKEKWKYALNELVKLGASVARDFWKVWEQPETEQIFKNVFITIGEIGRAVGNLAKQFRIAWDYNDTGLHILEHIRNIILIITKHIRNMATATADWAATLDFKPLLTAIEEWLGSLEPVMDAIMGVLEDFYKEVVLKFTKWVIESGLPDLIKVFKRFNDEVHWDDLRSKLAELWKHLEPFMETVGEGLIIFIDRVAQAIARFINGEKFEEFLQFIEDWMDSVTPEDVADGIEKLVKAIAGLKIAGIIVGGLSTFASVFGGLLTVCKGIGAIASGVSTFAGAIGGLGTALLPVIAIVGAIVIVMYSFVETYGGFEGALNKLKDVCHETHEKLKELADKANLIPKDFGNGHSAIENLAGAFGELKTAIGDCRGAWDMFFVFVQSEITFLGALVIPIISDIVQVLADLVSGLAGAVQAWGGFFDVIIGFFTGDKDRVKQGSEDLFGGIKKSFEGASGVINGSVEGLTDAIKAPWVASKTAILDGGIKDALMGAYDEVGEKQKEAGSLADKLSEKNSNLGVSLGKLGELHRDAQTTFKTHNDVLNEMKKKNDDVAGSLKINLENTTKVKEATDKLKSAVGDTDGIAKNYTTTLDGMRAALGTTKDAEKSVVEYSPTYEKSLENIRNAMSLTGEEAEKTGQNIVDGLKEPMKTANFDEESDAVLTNVIKSLIQKFQIGSPAKVMYPIGNDILLGISEGFKEMFKDFDSTFTDFYDNHVKTWFDKDKWSFDGVGEGLKKTFEGAKTAIKGVWNGIADKLNGEHEIGESKIKINLPKFAGGGFPSENGIFMANSSELVGRFSNGRTAVANNAMIVEGIERGVYNAVSSAMANNSGGSQYISNEIMVDGEVIARSITKAQEKMNRRYSPQTV